MRKVFPRGKKKVARNILSLSLKIFLTPATVPHNSPAAVSSIFYSRDFIIYRICFHQFYRFYLGHIHSRTFSHLRIDNVAVFI